MNTNIKDYLSLNEKKPTTRSFQSYNYQYSLELNNQSDFIIRRENTSRPNLFRELVFIPSDNLFYIRAKARWYTNNKQITSITFLWPSNFKRKNWNLRKSKSIFSSFILRTDVFIWGKVFKSYKQQRLSCSKELHNSRYESTWLLES